MADMAMIQGAVAGLKSATDIAKGLLEIKTIAEVQGKVIELQTSILSAQASALAAQSDQSSMTEEIRALKEEVARVRAWETVKLQYQLHEPSQGTFVYALKQGLQGGEPMHWICTRCYEEGRRSILQLKTRGIENDVHVCPSCSAEMKVRGTRPRPRVI